MGEISNKTLRILLIVMIIITVVGTFISIYRLRTVGQAVTGIIDLTIVGQASINVIDTSINFGSCQPTSGTGCTLDSSGSEPTCCSVAGGGGGNGVWPDKLAIENDGNRNLDLGVKTDTIAAGLIGGASPTFEFKAGQGEAGSCTGTLTTAWTNLAAVAPQEYAVCTNLGFGNSADLIDFWVQLFLPSDSVIGTKQATLTFVATGVI